MPMKSEKRSALCAVVYSILNLRVWVTKSGQIRNLMCEKFPGPENMVDFIYQNLHQMGGKRCRKIRNFGRFSLTQLDPCQFERLCLSTQRYSIDTITDIRANFTASLTPDVRVFHYTNKRYRGCINRKASIKFMKIMLLMVEILDMSFHKNSSKE